MSVSKRVLDIRNCQETKAEIVSLLAKDTKSQVKAMLPDIAELLSVIAELKQGNPLWDGIPFPSAGEDDEWEFDIQPVGDNKSAQYCVFLPKNVVITEDARIMILNPKDGGISETNIDVFSEYDESELYEVRKSLVSLNKYMHVLYKAIDAIISEVNEYASQAAKGQFTYAVLDKNIEESIDVSDVSLDEDEDTLTVSDEVKEDDDTENDESDNTEAELDNTDEMDFDSEDIDEEDDDTNDTDDESADEESEDTESDENEGSVDLADFDVEDDDDGDYDNNQVSSKSEDSSVPVILDDEGNSEEDDEFIPSVYIPVPKDEEDTEETFKDHVEIEFITEGNKNMMKFPLKYMPEAKSAPFKQYQEASFPLKDKSGRARLQVLGKYCKVVDDNMIRMTLDDRSHYILFLPSGKKSLTMEDLKEFLETQLV